MRRTLHALTSFWFVLAATGCYGTEIRSGSARPGAATHHHRQWFTVGGLVSLSEPAGDEWATRPARPTPAASSGSSDILLNVAIGVGSTAAGLAILRLGCGPQQLRHLRERDRGPGQLPPGQPDGEVPVPRRRERRPALIRRGCRAAGA